MKTEAFLSGSRVYGTPHEWSDIDLVVLCSPEVEVLLRAASGGYNSIKFGHLNVITCTDEDTYNKWKTVTEALTILRPVTKQQAVDALNEVGVGFGVSR